MPKRTDIKSVMVIGSGPIVIGQAAEFDYSGTQACRVLREEGIRVILVNSNPATIMTDPEMADATYIEPISTPILEQIIAKERPDALLPTLGGQTALNAAMALGEAGVLKKYNVELIGASLDAIDRGEDRELFKKVDLLEEFAVLATIDGVKGRADQLDVVLLEHARLAQRHGRVQRGLSAQRRQQRVRTFLGDDLLEDRGGDRLDVGGVGHFRIGHDGGRVGIDQNDPNALFAQHAAGLGARIIEFRGLADHDRTGADDHHGLDVCALRHCGFPP